MTLIYLTAFQTDAGFQTDTDKNDSHPRKYVSFGIYHRIVLGYTEISMFAPSWKPSNGTW